MFLEKLLYLAATVALAALAYLAWKAVALVSGLRETLSSVDESLKDIREVLGRVAEGLDPVFASARTSLEELARTNQRLQRLLDEAATLPPAVRELVLGLRENLRALTSDLSRTLERVDEVLGEGRGRLANEVPAILREVDELLRRVNGIVEEVQAKIQKTEELFQAVEETGRATRQVAEIVSQSILGTLVEVAAVAKGVEAGLRALRSKLISGGE